MTDIYADKLSDRGRHKYMQRGKQTNRWNTINTDRGIHMQAYGLRKSDINSDVYTEEMDRPKN